MEKDARTLKYRAGDMSPEEAKAYEKDLQQDPELKETWEFHERLSDDLALEKKLENLRQFHRQKVSSGYFAADEQQSQAEGGGKVVQMDPAANSSRIWKVAAAVALLVVAAWWALPKLSESPESQLAEVLLDIPQEQLPQQPDSNEEMGMTGKPKLQEELQEAYKLFKNKDFKGSIPLLERYLTAQQNDYEVRFMLALAYLQVENIADAQRQLQVLADKKLLANRQEVLLKLGAIYLQKGMGEQAMPLLEEVRQEGNERQQEYASKLLRM